MTEHEAGAEPTTFDRRSFMRKLAVGGFAIPVIASFRFDSLARGADTPAHTYGNQTYPNQTYGNGSFGHQPARLPQIPFPHR